MWLVVELLIVSVIVWYIDDFLYSQAEISSQPTGYDIENTFQVRYRKIGEDSPRFVNYGENAAERNQSDFISMFEQIRRFDGVEAASVSHAAEPYSFNWMGGEFMLDGDSTTFMGARYISMTPDHVNVFRYTPSRKGMSREDLVKALQEGKVLMTDFTGLQAYGAEKAVSADDFLGKRISLSRNNGTTAEVGGLVQFVKRSSSENLSSSVALLQPLDMTNPRLLTGYTPISIRVRDGEASGFKSRFAQAAKSGLFNRGNIAVVDIRSYDEIGRQVLHHDSVITRRYVACMLFMLLSVFLGILGTFWFRTRQRIGEIAVRKVNGASNPAIFRRLVGEAMILLSIATVPAVFIDWLICHSEMAMFTQLSLYFSWSRFVIEVVITYVIVALMVIAGTWYPARKAMTIEPALALKDE